MMFGRGSYSELGTILNKRKSATDDYSVFLVDKIFENAVFGNSIPVENNDLIYWMDVTEEPKTKTVDETVASILEKKGKLPIAIVGLGGGSVMDYAKSIGLMLTNEGSASEYQGLDLIKNKGVHTVVVPTISGTGAEVSMTAVLTGPEKKLGIKCDYTVPDQMLLDPDLIRDVPNPQRFYTGMDCFIHNVESLNGTWNNVFSIAYGEKSLEMSKEVFINPNISREEADDKLMIASLMGGLSLTYSQVGACHALSYGLSYVMGTKHGIGNCIAFNVLDEFYQEGVDDFRKMMDIHGIELPKNYTANVTEDEMNKMIDTALSLEFMWDHLIGKDWQKTITRDKLRVLYERM